MHTSVTQRHESLSSLVIKFHSNTTIAGMAAVVAHKMISSPMNSSRGIKFSIVQSLNNLLSLNILCPVVVRQYFGHNLQITQVNDYFVNQCTYGLNSGLSSVSMDPYNFVTHNMTYHMDYMDLELYIILLSHTFFNMDHIDLNKIFNHCSVIIHYSGDRLKESSSLDYQSEYVPFILNAEFFMSTNS